MKNTTRRLPLIPLRGITVFPNMILSFAVGREKSMKSLETAMENDENVFLVTQISPDVNSPSINDVYSIGTMAKIKQVLKLPGNITHVIVEGVNRGKILRLEDENRYITVEILEIPQDNSNELTDKDIAFMRFAADLFDEYGKNGNRGGEVAVNVISSSRPGQLADVIASGIDISAQKRQELLEILEPNERLKAVTEILNYEIQIINIKKDIETKLKKRLDQSQKEYYLREQIRVIQEELGDKDGIKADVDNMQQRLLKKGIVGEAAEHIKKEIERFSKIPSTSPESNVSRNYLETVLELPWNEHTKEAFDISKSRKILEKDHYGLEKVKERILEYLAVRAKTNDISAPIICLVGPPGVGKTSIAKSVAKALNRKYVRMSLGGVKDEAEIRGHRKTYIGAMPGRIISAMRQAKVKNPLILLDEVDKLGVSHNGDPASALLEVLDGEQNNTFRDHYIEIPYDLSEVLFMCTANTMDTVPPALKDRMEVIQLSSYTLEEKKNIAIKHLYPKQIKKHGLKKSNIKIPDNIYEDIIEYYTREAGVRNLERIIGNICRKTVKQLMEENKSVSLNEKNIEEYLGPKKYHHNKMFKEPQTGIVCGLAWTQVGGETLTVEVNTMRGTGKLELTGNMGDVMKESAKAAISYIRSNNSKYSLADDFYKEMDIHIHIPEGAVPKDGPSAGITMATAMISALTNVPVRNDIAMTGEITIRGRVLPIGGLKEKVIAAKRAGITTVIIPYENENDLSEISENIKNGMSFVFAKGINDVIKTALVESGAN